MTSAQAVLALVGSGGIGAVLASIIQSWVNRRNLDASTTKLITDAASGVVSMLKEQNREQAARIEELEQKLKEKK